MSKKINRKNIFKKLILHNSYFFPIKIKNPNRYFLFLKNKNFWRETSHILNIYYEQKFIFLVKNGDLGMCKPQISNFELV